MLFSGLVLVGSRREEVVAAPVPPQPPWFPGRIQAGKVLPGTLTLRPWSRGSCKGSLMNSASCCVSGCTSRSSTTAGGGGGSSAGTKEGVGAGKIRGACPRHGSTWRPAAGDGGVGGECTRHHA